MGAFEPEQQLMVHPLEELSARDESRYSLWR